MQKLGIAVFLNRSLRVFATTAGLFLLCLVVSTPRIPVHATEIAIRSDLATLFESFPGRWVGEGRLYTKGGKTEMVRCRVTYFLSNDKAELKQNIRCASGGGKIELKSVIHHNHEKISGTWHETIYELKGELSGRQIKDGLLVHAKGEGLQATMQLLFMKGKQVAEIQFNHATLVGLTLVLVKG